MSACSIELAFHDGGATDRSWPLWKAFHNGHYAKFSVMASWALTSLQTVSYTGGPTRSCTSHNFSFFRNSSNEPDALKRRLAVYAGTCADNGPSSNQARTVGCNTGILADTSARSGNRPCYLSGEFMSSAVRPRTAERKCPRGLPACIVPELFITGNFA